MFETHNSVTNFFRSLERFIGNFAFFCALVSTGYNAYDEKFPVRQICHHVFYKIYVQAILARLFHYMQRNQHSWSRICQGLEENRIYVI